MNRRIPVAILCVATLAVAGAYLFRRPAAPVFASTADQNVLLITIDTLRADALGSYGGRARTPRLDQLAAAGARYSFAHAHAVMTLPSHASILTGRYPFEHGARDNAGFRLDDSAVTLAELARQRGMATGAFVGAFPLERQFGLAQGFDVYEDTSGRTSAVSDFALAERPAPEVVGGALSWIRQQQRPWLAWVHVFEPHSPYAAPAPYRQEYANDAYAGEVAYVDSALAPLLEAARSSARRTLVVVTSDHGEGLGDHGEATHGVFAYESTLRVPLIVAQVGGGEEPASTSRGAVFDSPVRHVDILPTIAALAQLAAPAELPGRPLPLDREDTEPRASYFEALHPMLTRGWAPLTGALDGREKYIDLPVPELYDLATDAREQQNLAAGASERARTMTARLAQFGARLPGAAAGEHADVRARLQSLGYLSGSAPRKATYTEEDDPKRLIALDGLMMEGIRLHHAGRSAEAIAAFEGVISKRPDMVLAYRHLAFVQWESGRANDAITTLRRALAVSGRSLETEVRLGTYLAESGNPAAAVEVLEDAAREAPSDAEALNALGIAYARAGRRDDARKTFERILAANPRDVQAYENLGTLHLGHDMKVAEAAFTRALEVAPSSSRAHAGLGVVAVNAGRRNDAIAHWARAVQLDPRNFDALFNLTTELLNAGRVAEARPYAEQFVRTAPRAFYGRDIDRLMTVLR